MKEKSSAELRVAIHGLVRASSCAATLAEMACESNGVSGDDFYNLVFMIDDVAARARAIESLAD